jgi:radical SAM superfamily enzyme YgiQ (UPF0313 family)
LQQPFEGKGMGMNSRKVVLFFPNTGFDIKGVSVDLPLAVLNLAAFLRDDFDVSIIDQRVEPDWRERLTCELEQEPLCLGVSSMTCPQILYGLEASIMARKISPNTVTVWGGVHPTLMPRSTLRNALIDIVVRDQGEVPFAMLLQALAKNRRTDLRKLPSLSFIDGGTYVETPLLKETKNRLDQFPELPYDLLRAGVETYVGSQGRFADPETRSLIVITSVGCPYRCEYCAMPGMESTRAVTAESPDFTVRRIAKLVEKYNINAIAFHDEEFMVNPKRIIAIAERIVSEIGGRKTGFRWWCQTRMDSMDHLANWKGKNYLPLLAESGLESFQPGIESGSNRILEMIQKQETAEEFIRVNLMLAQYDEFKPLYNFMVGFPTETIAEMKQTLRLAEQMVDENPHAMIAGVYIVVPYPGTEIYDKALKAGFVPPTTLEEWAQFNRQQLLTPWVAGNPEVLQLAEFARLTSRFIDGKRLPLRLDHSFGGLSGLSEKDFLDLSRIVKDRWRTGDFSNVEIFRAFNNLVLALYTTARNLEPIIRKVNGKGIGVDERAKELIVDTSLRLGGNEIKERDAEYLTTQSLLEKYGPLPQREVIGFEERGAVDEGKTELLIQPQKLSSKV